MLSITIPWYAVVFLSSFGFIFFSYLLYRFLKLLEWKIFKTTKPQSPLHYKMFLLEEENKKLTKKINSLEEENSKIINSLIKHLQG